MKGKRGTMIKLCFYEFRLESHSKRVWLGYFVGSVVILKQTMGYLLYSSGAGLSENVLEAFIISGNTYNTVMFLVLGWLLVISEAPFVNHNSTFLIYRTTRRKWNGGMLLYILLQGICYYAILALSSIIPGMANGYFADIWSSAIINLGTNRNAFNGIEVYFPYHVFMKEVSVFKAFALTWTLCFAYGLIIAMILYVFNLFANRVMGVLAAFAFHFLGYEIMKEGFMVVIRYSLLARSVPVLLIGSNLGVSTEQSYLLFMLIAAGLTTASAVIIKHVDFNNLSRGKE